MGFVSTPLSLGSGAAGPALFLHMTGGIPADALAWMDARLNEALDGRSHLPPGLYTGAAGVAVTLSALGRPDQAANLLVRAVETVSLTSDPSFFQGSAGVGWACLNVYQSHPDPRLERAVERLALQLLDSAVRDDEIWYWAPPGAPEEVPVPIGLAHGASGIALFLTAAADLTGDDALGHAARRALDGELAHVNDTDGTFRWGATWGGGIEKVGVSPYWRAGTAGVGVALLRLAQLTGDPDLLAAALQAGRGVEALFAGAQGHFEGMSGIGHFLLDLYDATGAEWVLRQAHTYAQSAMCFRVERADGSFAFMGRGYDRLSADYGYGAAGVGLFFHRLANPKRRSCYDLP